MSNIHIFTNNKWIFPPKLECNWCQGLWSISHYLQKYSKHYILATVAMHTLMYQKKTIAMHKSSIPMFYKEILWDKISFHRKSPRDGQINALITEKKSVFHNSAQNQKEHNSEFMLYKHPKYLRFSYKIT